MQEDERFVKTTGAFVRITKSASYFKLKKGLRQAMCRDLKE